jgi:hypothetical protein
MRHMWKTLQICYARSAHVKDARVEPELVVHISEAIAYVKLAAEQRGFTFGR